MPQDLEESFYIQVTPFSSATSEIDAEYRNLPMASPSTKHWIINPFYYINYYTEYCCTIESNCFLISEVICLPWSKWTNNPHNNPRQDRKVSIQPAHFYVAGQMRLLKIMGSLISEHEKHN